VHIKELYRDKEAPVKPFDHSLILDTWYDFLDKNKKIRVFEKMRI
jgi:hypothetical protein